MSNIILLEESLPPIRMLSDAEAGALLKALILHLNGYEPDDLPGKAALLYPFVKGQMDRMNELSERRAAAGRLGGSKTQANAKQNSSKLEANLKQTSSKSEANVKQIESKSEALLKQNQANVTALNNTYCNNLQSYSYSSDSVSKEKEKEREKKDKKKVDLPDTGIWADTQVREAFADYAKMRIRIKKSMTQEAVKRKIPQLERLASTPADAVDIIHRATDNCWLDFYADRQTAKTKEPGYIKRGTDYDSFLNQIGV